MYMPATPLKVDNKYWRMYKLTIPLSLITLTSHRNTYIQQFFLTGHKIHHKKNIHVCATCNSLRFKGET